MDVTRRTNIGKAAAGGIAALVLLAVVVGVPAAETYYLGGDHTLNSQRPGGAGSETLDWAPATSATTLTYTSTPLPSAAVLDGPTDVTVYAESSTDREPEGTVVRPNGRPNGRPGIASGVASWTRTPRARGTGA